MHHWCATFQWRHNEHDGVSNHQPHDFLLTLLFRRRSKKTSKLRVTGLCAGNSPVTGEFPAQMASNAENDSVWLRLHDVSQKHVPCFVLHCFVVAISLAPSILVIDLPHSSYDCPSASEVPHHNKTQQGINVSVFIWICCITASSNNVRSLAPDSGNNFKILMFKPGIQNGNLGTCCEIYLSGECQRTSLIMKSQHWFSLWLGDFGRPAITRANVDPDLCRDMVSMTTIIQCQGSLQNVQNNLD